MTCIGIKPITPSDGFGACHESVRVNHMSNSGNNLPVLLPCVNLRVQPAMLHYIHRQIAAGCGELSILGADARTGQPQRITLTASHLDELRPLLEEMNLAVAATAPSSGSSIASPASELPPTSSAFPGSIASPANPVAKQTGIFASANLMPSPDHPDSPSAVPSPGNQPSVQLTLFPTTGGAP